MPLLVRGTIILKMENHQYAVVVDRADVQKARALLLKNGWFDTSRRPAPVDAGCDVVAGSSKKTMMMLPILHHVLKEDVEAALGCTVVVATLQASKGSAKQTPHARMVCKLQALVKAAGGLSLTATLEAEIPKRWEKHGDLAMLPENSFATESAWAELPDLWTEVAAAIGASRVARRARIDPGLRRESRAVLLKGEDGWVTHMDNGVRYVCACLPGVSAWCVCAMLLFVFPSWRVFVCRNAAL